MLGFEFDLTAGLMVRWAFNCALFGAFMLWPIVLIMTPVHGPAEGGVVVIYSVATFLVGSLFFATMLEPVLPYATARQLYLIYLIMMSGLCVKGMFHAFGGQRFL
ncbi:MAG: hypothetical protein AAF141_09030 [Pseudomonadota bacterium]